MEIKDLMISLDEKDLIVSDVYRGNLVLMSIDKLEDSVYVWLEREDIILLREHIDYLIKKMSL